MKRKIFNDYIINDELLRFLPDFKKNKKLSSVYFKDIFNNYNEPSVVYTLPSQSYINSSLVDDLIKNSVETLNSDELIKPLEPLALNINISNENDNDVEDEDIDDEEQEDDEEDDEDDDQEDEEEEDDDEEEDEEDDDITSSSEIERLSQLSDTSMSNIYNIPQNNSIKAFASTIEMDNGYINKNEFSLDIQGNDAKLKIKSNDEVSYDAEFKIDDLLKSIETNNYNEFLMKINKTNTDHSISDVSHDSESTDMTQTSESKETETSNSDFKYLLSLEQIPPAEGETQSSEIVININHDKSKSKEIDEIKKPKMSYEIE